MNKNKFLSLYLLSEVYSENLGMSLRMINIEELKK